MRKVTVGPGAIFKSAFAWVTAASVLAVAAGCGEGAGGNGEDSPARIVGLLEVRGDSNQALDDYHNGATMGLEWVNDEGGVLGRPMEYERIPASVIDPQAARTAFLRAVDSEPSALFGFPGGGSLEALTRDIDSAAIPMIHVSSDGKLARGAEAGSEWLFSINPDDRARASNAVELAQQIGGQEIGVIATDETFGRTSTENAIAAIEEAGLELGPVRYVSPTATDLTGPVLEMRDVDVVLSWTFPNILALQLNQMAQNGIDTPVIGGNSAPLVVSNDLVRGQDRDPLYGVTPCAPARGESEIGREFAAEYEERFGMEPTPSATQVFDTVRFLAASMEDAGTTTDHEQIAESMRTVEWTQGACAPVYKSDGAHFLGHQMVAEAFAGDGEIVATYEVAEREEG